jgi:radical SAM protein with 4Fe4S-binding SPASM domain
LACLHCGSDCTKDISTPDLPAQVILDVLEEVKEAYDEKTISIVLSGGEPTCYPRLFDLGREITDLGFPWGMVTNGFSWSERTSQQAAEAGLGSIAISLDGLQKEHDWLRGRPGSFARALATIETLLRRPCYHLMDVISCVSQRTLGVLDSLHDLLAALKVPAWRLFTISPIGRASMEPELFLDGQQFRWLLDKVKMYRDRSRMRVSYSESGYLGPQYECRVRDQHFFCQAGVSVSGVMVNGDILACPNIDRRLKQGNVYSDSFVDVWEHRYKPFRDRAWMRTGDCVNCKQWRSCGGNSLHLWDPDKGRTRLCYHRLLNDEADR